MNLIDKSRIAITITSYKKACPYCKKKPIKKTCTCGDSECQYKHHIFQMRKRRKTDIKRPSCQIKF